jgi:tetratricopeptide (TPR) repeat protein
MITDWERGIPREMARVWAGPIAVSRGEIALAEGKGREALVAFRKGAAKSCPACAAMTYARAFEQLGQADSTIYWYEKVLASTTNRMFQVFARRLARTYKRLGELYEAKGDLKNAIQRYSDFIALWKDADTSLQPAVQDARDRVAKLQAKRG